MSARFDVTKLPANMRSKIMVSVDQVETNGSVCWEWTGATNSRGYGSVTNGRGSSALTHRKVYELLVGEIPRGLTIDHLCFNKLCVNTDHLEPVTGAVNTRRALARQTHCKQGHELAGWNLKRVKRSTGLVYRTCRTCQNGWQRQRYARRKAEVVV